MSYIDLAKAKSEDFEGSFKKCLSQVIQLLLQSCSAIDLDVYKLTESWGESKMIPRQRMMHENRGGRGGGKEKLPLHAVIVCLVNTVLWIDGSSDWCGFRCLIASFQSTSSTFWAFRTVCFLIP